ncbi:MAG: hypothetical protein AAFY84_00275 [Pseudomonadota bacterium]
MAAANSQSKQQLRHLVTLSNAVTTVFQDLQAAQKGIEVLYNIDFSLISGFISLHPHAAHEFERGQSIPSQLQLQSRDMDLIGSSVFSLLHHYAEDNPFKATISLATILELQKSLFDLSDQFAKQAMSTSHVDRLEREIEEIYSKNGDFIESKDAVARIRRASALLPDRRHTEELDHLISLLERGVLRGLGDYYAPAEIRNVTADAKALSGRIFDYLNTNRRRSYGEIEVDFNFRNRIDAVNIAFSHALSNSDPEGQVSFVGPVFNKLQRSSLAHAMEFRRNPLAPFLWMNALDINTTEHQSSSERVGEGLEYLEMMYTRVRECINYLESVDSYSELSTPKQREVVAFHEQYYHPIMTHVTDKRADLDADLARIKNFFEEGRDVRKSLQEAQESVSTKARQFAELTPDIIDEDILDAYDLHKDLKVKELLAALKS